MHVNKKQNDKNNGRLYFHLEYFQIGSDILNSVTVLLKLLGCHSAAPDLGGQGVQAQGPPPKRGHPEQRNEVNTKDKP